MPEEEKEGDKALRVWMSDVREVEVVSREDESEVARL